MPRELFGTTWNHLTRGGRSDFTAKVMAVSLDEGLKLTQIICSTRGPLVKESRSKLNDVHNTPCSLIPYTCTLH